MAHPALTAVEGLGINTVDCADEYRPQADNIRPDGSLAEAFPQGTPPAIIPSIV